MKLKNFFIQKWKSLLFYILLGIFFFSSTAKALLLGGLMQIGLFQVSLSKDKEKVQPLPDHGIQFLELATNKVVHLEALKGKVVFINFWATWCFPCLAELPSINKMYQQLKDEKDMVFLMVEVDGNGEKAVKIFNRKKYGMPLYIPKSTLPEVLLGTSIPTSVILDKQGALVFKHEGAANYNDKNLVEFVKSKLQE